MSAEPIDDGGPVHPWTRQIRCGGLVEDTENIPGISYRADVAKECLAALVGGMDVTTATIADIDAAALLSLHAADSLILQLKGGAK